MKEPDTSPLSDEPVHETKPRPLRHSELGIASIVLFVISCLFTFAIWLLMAIAAGDRKRGGEGAAMNAGLIFFSGTSLNLAGAICGLAGLFQRQRKKNLAASGLVLNIILPIINVLVAVAASPWRG
jgi:heme/copper-type cytochrome/quinol oxidase subunit 3